jgi:ATP-binding cassette subfamily G (WHITE) protein 2
MGPGLHAIMGPTGSGKTTLLDILADRINKRGLQGTILVNGQRQPKNFKCMTGYVVQDDVVMGTLTVKENLYFSAALRLPLSVPWSEKRRRVKKIIEDLGLTACADTKVSHLSIQLSMTRLAFNNRNMKW